MIIINRFIIFKLFILLSLLTGLGSVVSFAQNEANIWWFGQKAGLDFNTSPPTVLNTTIPIFTYEGSATISDPVTGQLIFATDGITVWYPNGTVVPGGTGLKGNFSSAQSALIVPNPANVNQWFIFTANVNPPNGTPYGHNYYVVTRTGSTLAVGAATNLLGPTVSTEQLAGLGDGAGGYWIVTHELGNNKFHAFHVTSAGTVVTTPVTSAVGTAIGANDYIASMKSNTCQNKLALTNLGSGIVEVYNFNNATGAVTSLQYSITGLTQPYGLEFSPNDAYLYFGTLAGQIYQMNMSTGTATNTGWTAPPNGVGNVGQMQLAPDGKIYVSSENINTTSYLGVISSPNNVYTSAGYSATGLQVSTVNSYYPLLGLPTFSRTFVSGILEAFPGDGGYCVNTDIPLSYTFTGSVTSQTWSVSPGAGWSYTAGTGTSVAPTIRFTSTGTYTVQLDVVSCSRTYTESMTFTITAPLTAAGSISCSNPNLVLDNPAVDANEPLYLWYDGPAPTGKLIGVGTPVNYAVGSDISKPANVYVEVGSAASITSSGSSSIGPAASTFGWSANVLSSSYTSPTLNVLSDILVLKSFDVKPRTGFCTGTLNVLIKNSSGTTVFNNNFAANCVGGIFTVPINTTLPKGNGYTIVLSSATMQLDGNGSAVAASSTTQGTYASAVAGALSIGNIQYDYKNFSVTTRCSNRTAVPVNCVLPVELIEFAGKKSGSSVRLYWSTSSEINNSHFIAEHSIDGINFTSIGKVSGTNSKEFSSYELFHNNPYKGINYYRLAQYDFDGTITYCSVITVRMDNSGDDLFTVMPNPSDDQFTISLNDSFSDVEISLYDALGKLLYKQNVFPNEQKIMLGSELAKGIYILTLSTDKGFETKRIIKIK